MFTCVPAYGHLLPLADLVRAAAAAGHQPAVLTSAGMAAVIEAELPGVLHLPAGQTLRAVSAATAERLEEDLNASPRFVLENFGGTRLDDGAETATDRTRVFAPDLIIAEMFDTVGPLVAAALGVPWHTFGLGPAFSDEVTAALAAVTAPRYAARALEPVSPVSYIDIWPQDLQVPGWRSPVTHHPMRQHAHHRTTPDRPLPRLTDPSRPQVLVTLGTVFSTPQLLRAVLGAVVSDDINVLATGGFSITDDLTADTAGTDTEPGAIEATNVRTVPFVPLDQLLDRTDVVVTVGGAGTVLGALSRGVPMVLWPQYSGQHEIAELAAATGAATVVAEADELTDAVTRVRADPTYRDAARRQARRIDAMPTPAAVVDALTSPQAPSAGSSGAPPRIKA